MTRHTSARALAGVVLLVLALGVALLALGIGDAARQLRETQAYRQRGLAPHTAERAGRVQVVAEQLLGIRAQSELMRAYDDYRFGLSTVIEGTRYPQTQARWNAISTIDRLRPSLTRAPDRAAADLILGVVYAGSATASGPGGSRQTLVRHAVDSFTRAVLEDPGSAAAKQNLELLIAAAADAEARARTRNTGRNDPTGRPTPTPQAQPPGTGY
jgi:hypothetical protein